MIHLGCATGIRNHNLTDLSLPRQPLDQGSGLPPSVVIVCLPSIMLTTYEVLLYYQSISSC